jgi:hypothetical protein
MSSSFPKLATEEERSANHPLAGGHGYLRLPAATSNIHASRLVSGLRRRLSPDYVRRLPRTSQWPFAVTPISTTVAGAAPDFDRLPDFQPSLAGQHLELANI